MTELKVKVFDLLMEKQTIFEDANRVMSEIQFNVDKRSAEIQKEVDALIEKIEGEKK